MLQYWLPYFKSVSFPCAPWCRLSGLATSLARGLEILETAGRGLPEHGHQTQVGFIDPKRNYVRSDPHDSMHIEKKSKHAKIKGFVRV